MKFLVLFDWENITASFFGMEKKAGWDKGM
jgi:hypothetical protein